MWYLCGVINLVPIIRILLCAICVLACHRPLGILLSKDGNGIFNVCSKLFACCAQNEGETGIDLSPELKKRPSHGH